jgi:hypothetical protein
MHHAVTIIVPCVDLIVHVYNASPLEKKEHYFLFEIICLKKVNESCVSQKAIQLWSCLGLIQLQVSRSFRKS